jgi:hypothetical protein
VLGATAIHLAEHEWPQSQQTGSSAQQQGTLGDKLWDIFGNNLGPKGRDIMRIGFQNFNGLSFQPNNPVDDRVRQWITDNEFDVFGLSEVNLWWHSLPAALQFRKRIREWWDASTVRSVLTSINTANGKPLKGKDSIRRNGSNQSACGGFTENRARH